MAMKLVALDDDSDIVLRGPVTVVGRHPACDARLESLRVSRRHCTLVRENGEIVVRDLGSTNGTRINGNRVEVGRLERGDELSIAHIRYRLEDGRDGPQDGPDRPEPDRDGPQPIPRRPQVSDLLSPTSRIGFISRN